MGKDNKIEIPDNDEATPTKYEELETVKILLGGVCEAMLNEEYRTAMERLTDARRILHELV